MLRLTPICNVLRISDVNDDQSLVLDSSCSQTATDIAGRGGGGTCTFITCIDGYIDVRKYNDFLLICLDCRQTEKWSRFIHRWMYDVCLEKN